MLCRSESFILIWPDEDHVAWRSSEGDDEGGDDWESQEVGEHPVTVVSVMALTHSGRKVTSSADAAAVREDLETRSNTASQWRVLIYVQDTLSW